MATLHTVTVVVIASRVGPNTVLICTDMPLISIETSLSDALRTVLLKEYCKGSFAVVAMLSCRLPTRTLVVSQNDSSDTAGILSRMLPRTNPTCSTATTGKLLNLNFPAPLPTGSLDFAVMSYVEEPAGLEGYAAYDGQGGNMQVRLLCSFHPRSRACNG